MAAGIFILYTSRSKFRLLEQHFLTETYSSEEELLLVMTMAALSSIGRMPTEEEEVEAEEGLVEEPCPHGQTAQS